MSADRIVFICCLLVSAFLIGMEYGDTKLAVHLQPCPDQDGMKQSSSTYDTTNGLQCHYKPAYQARKV